jgi:inosose dehydratase
MISIGNAPCSWGTLEFEGAQTERLTFVRVLDELAETGYTGTELGDWGFMPTDPVLLRNELQCRKLTMTGAFVPVYFKDRAAHAGGEARAVRTAKLLAAVADANISPFIVLADDNCRDLIRTQNSGRATPDMMLRDNDWRVFADGVNRVAQAVKSQTGLRCVFHHHGGGYVETHEEIERLLELTDPALVGLVFDTGHYAFGAQKTDGADILWAMNQFAPRIWYVHLKDCSPRVAAAVAANGWDYHTAVRNGVFCELGQGCVPFDRVAVWLHAHHYSGFATVEQDVLPGMGQPKESAARNRAYLRSIGL